MSSDWLCLLASLQYQISINLFILPKESIGMISTKGTVTLQIYFNLNTKGLDEIEGHRGQHVV